MKLVYTYLSKAYSWKAILVYHVCLEIGKMPIADLMFRLKREKIIFTEKLTQTLNIGWQLISTTLNAIYHGRNRTQNDLFLSSSLL